MSELVNYEALRLRHAVDAPLRALTDLELDALVESCFTYGPMRDLAFLAACERQDRHASR